MKYFSYHTGMFILSSRKFWTRSVVQSGLQTSQGPWAAAMAAPPQTALQHTAATPVVASESKERVYCATRWEYCFAAKGVALPDWQHLVFTMA